MNTETTLSPANTNEIAGGSSLDFDKRVMNTGTTADDPWENQDPLFKILLAACSQTCDVPKVYQAVLSYCAAIAAMNKLQVSEVTIKSDNTQTLINALAKIDGAMEVVKSLREALQVAATAEVYMPEYGVIDADMVQLIQSEARKALTAADQWLAGKGK